MPIQSVQTFGLRACSKQWDADLYSELLDLPSLENHRLALLLYFPLQSLHEHQILGLSIIMNQTDVDEGTAN